jgi:hypothetical protein
LVMTIFIGCRSCLDRPAVRPQAVRAAMPPPGWSA